MSELKAEAIQKIENAISEVEAFQNINLEFDHGYAIGLISAFRNSGVITWEEYLIAQQRISTIHKQQLESKRQ